MPDAADDNPTPTKRKPITPSIETKPAPDKKKGKKDKPEPTTFGGKLWHNWVRPIGTVIIIVVVLRSMLLDWNDVPTGSMEPEIQVGDRIAVNRLAYALQAPLSGPKLSIPWTGLAWDNPLDGIPQWQWGKPKRGDIVTFWNPITGIRMVKRIVAEPGDTISMSGGVMTINGTQATYADIDPDAEGLTGETKWQFTNQLGKPDYAEASVEYQNESMLGESRILQHIKGRWIQDGQIIELSNGNRLTVDEGWIIENFKRVRELDDYLSRNPQVSFQVLAEIKDGVIYLDQQTVSYNDLAALLLQPFETGDVGQILDKIGLSFDTHRMIVDDQPVAFEIFRDALSKRAGQLDKDEQATLNQLTPTLLILHNATMTNFGPVTLGEDEYFMVGDNRNNSHDSRMFGPINRGEITGEAFAVAFSFKDNKILAIPPKPAWSRWFKDLD